MSNTNDKQQLQPPAPSPEELYQQASDEVFGEMMAQKKSQQAGQDAEYLKSMTEQHPQYGTKIGRFSTAVGTGAAKALLETKDFIFGEPEEAEKSQGRKNIESMSRALSNESMAYSLAGGVSQFTVGMLGAGKLLAPVKAVDNLKKGGKAARAVYETGRGALAASVVIDPHEERLSDLIQSYPSLENPLTEYLASNPEDSAAEGRLKNALEGIGMDIALVGTFALSVKALKYLKAGDEEKALKALADSEAAEARNREAYSMDFTGSPSGTIQAKAAEINGDGLNKLSMPQVEGQAGGLEVRPEVPNTQSVDVDDIVTPPQTAIETHGEASSLTSSNPTGKGLEAISESTGSNQAGATISEPLSSPSVPESTALRPADEAKVVNPQHIEITDDNIVSLLQATDTDLKAIAKYGSREAARDAGEATANGTRLPWHKLRATEGVQTFVDNAATVLKNQMDARKGGDILADQSVSDMVHARAELFGEDPTLVMGQLSKAGTQAASMVADMEASYLIANSMFKESYDLAVKVRNGMLDEFGGDAVKATEELKARLTAVSDLVAAGQSIASNSGRALRRMRKDFQFKPDDIASIQQMDGRRLADIILTTNGNPKKLAQMVNPSFLKRTLDGANFLLANNLLWLWTTHAVNISSNLYMLAARPLEKAIGSLAIPITGSPIRQQAMKEYAYTVSSLGDAWTAMKDVFLKGDSILNPQGTEYTSGGASGIRSDSIQFKPHDDLFGIVHNAMALATPKNIIGLPTRALGAVDEFVKTLRYRAVVQAEASVQASSRGLEGNDLKQFVQAALDRAIDPATGQATNPRALQEAQITTFQQELLSGTMGATVRNIRAAHPSLGLVLPFIKTPVNVFRYGVKMTPALNMVQQEYRRAILGEAGQEAQAHAFGQMALGASFMGLAGSMAAEGMITGAGPNDPKLQAELAATGWKPYSWGVDNKDGSRTYIPLGKLDPVGMVMGIAADLANIIALNPEDKNAQSGLDAFAVAFMKNITNRSFLQGINNVIEAVMEPEGKGAKYAGNLGSNLVPLSSLMRGLNDDPYMRETRNFTDNLLKNIPAFSDSLPPVRDAYGEPIWKRIGLSTTQEIDLVEAEHNRIMLETGKGIGKPVPNRNGVDLRDLTLESGQNAYDRLQELSGQLPNAPSLKVLLAKIIGSESYKVLPDGDAETKGTKLWMLAGKVSEYRALAWKKLRVESPLVRDALVKRQAETRDALHKNMKDQQQKQMSGGQKLSQALGIQ